MAGTVTITYDGDPDILTGPINRVIKIDWVADALGAADATTKKICGWFTKVVAVNGVPTPDPNYDVVLKEVDKGDKRVFGNVAKNLQNLQGGTTDETIHMMEKDYAGTPLAQSLRVPVCSTISIAITNADNVSAGTLYLYWMTRERGLK